MRKNKNSKKAEKQKKKIWKSGLQAGCLALGMATAWGGEALGEVTLSVSATPLQTLTNAFVYYHGNNSITGLESLGALPAGQTTVVLRTVSGDIENYSGYGCVVIGLHDADTDPGVSISFPDDGVLTSNKQWSDIFEASPVSHYNHTEAEVVNALFQAASGDLDPLWNCLYYSAAPVGAAYGNEGTLVNFSDPTSGGVVTVDVTAVPEPAAWMLLVTATGSLLCWRRDLQRS